MKKILKIGGILILVFLVFYTFFMLWKKSRPKEITYNVVEVAIGAIQKNTVATGKIQPRNEILIKPQLSGIITHVYKEAGDKLKAGDVIAKIKVIPDMVSLSAAESRVERSILNFEQAAKDYERSKALFAEKVLTNDDFEKVELQYKTGKEEVKAAQDNLSLIRDGITKNNAIASNTLAISTITGTLLDVPIKVGNSVIQSNNFNDGTTIATVADMSDMIFVGNLDETEIGKLSIGMPMDIYIGALNENNLKARLEYISPKGQESNGAILFEMKSALEIPDSLFIRAGYSANASIILAKVDSVLTVPESCIEIVDGKSYVYVLTNEKPQQFEKKEITLGLSDGIFIEVKSGLKEKEKIRGGQVF